MVLPSVHQPLYPFNHFSKEFFTTTEYSTFITPQQSPLLVRFIESCRHFVPHFSNYVQDLFHNSINWLRDTGTLEKLNDMEYTRLKADKTWLQYRGWFEKFKRTETTYEEFRAPAHEYNPKVRVDQPLSIYQLAPAFMILGFGITFALIGFGGEFCRH